MRLRQSTAVAISFGPFDDPTDGITPVTGIVSALDHASTGIKLSKNGGALTIRHAAVTASSYDTYGNYIVTLDATDTNTLGTLRVQFADKTLTVPVWMDFEVVNANEWDSSFGTSVFKFIDVKQWLTGTIPAVNVTGVPIVDAKYLLGSIFATPTNPGVPDVNAKTWNNLATVALPLTPTVSGRSLDVSAGGEAGVDWANVGSPTTTVNLSGTTISTTQKVDVDTIKTNPVVNGGTITFPTNATLASTTNITAGTIATVSGDVVGNVQGSVASVTGAVGSVTGNVGGSVASVTGNVGGNLLGTLTSTERNAIADAWIARNVAGGSSAGRTNKQAMAAMRNRATIVAGTITVYDVDDSTPLWDGTVTTAAGNPIASIDPS